VKDVFFIINLFLMQGKWNWTRERRRKKEYLQPNAGGYLGSSSKMKKVPFAIHSGLNTTDNFHTELVAPKLLVAYGSSSINSDEESPLPKRSRQGTIGAEGRAQIMAAQVYFQQQPMTRKSSFLP